MELYLIRHAQSLNNARPRNQRVEDPPLTDLGDEQARLLGEWIPELQIDAVVTSPFLRTLQTTRHIHRTTRLQPTVRTRLHELGGCVSGSEPESMIGRPGMGRSEISRKFPTFDIAPEIDERGWWGSQPYECEEAALLRARDLLQQTHQEFGHTDCRVAYVTHADFTMLLLARFHREVDTHPSNASVSKVVMTAEGTHLETYNTVDHLPPELITG